jgi:hypothetical protein
MPFEASRTRSPLAAAGATAHSPAGHNPDATVIAASLNTRLGRGILLIPARLAAHGSAPCYRDAAPDLNAGVPLRGLGASPVMRAKRAELPGQRITLRIAHQAIPASHRTQAQPRPFESLSGRPRHQPRRHRRRPGDAGVLLGR